jgi:hypothetical protein
MTIPGHTVPSRSRRSLDRIEARLLTRLKTQQLVPLSRPIHRRGPK